MKNIEPKVIKFKLFLMDIQHKNCLINQNNYIVALVLYIRYMGVFSVDKESLCSENGLFFRGLRLDMSQKEFNFPVLDQLTELSSEPDKYLKEISNLYHNEPIVFSNDSLNKTIYIVRACDNSSSFFIAESIDKKELVYYTNSKELYIIPHSAEQYDTVITQIQSYSDTIYPTLIKRYPQTKFNLSDEMRSDSILTTIYAIENTLVLKYTDQFDKTLIRFFI